MILGSPSEPVRSVEILFTVERRISIAPIVIVPLFCGKKINFLEKMGKTMDEAIATALLQKGRVTMTDLYSAKKNKYFNADLVMEIEDGKARFQLEFPKNTTRKKEN